MQPRYLLFTAVLILLCGMEYSLAASALSAGEYRAELERVEATLRRVENQPARPLAAILKTLSKTITVRRNDGSIQKAGADEWQRRATDAGANATRAQIREARQSVQARLRALDEWTNTVYEPADAQGIMRSWERSGIRTGPTRWEQLQSDIGKWVRDLLRSLGGWMGRALPPGSPNVNADAVRLFFIACAVSLLSLLVYFAWRALSKRWAQEAAQRQVRLLGDEDVELLQLPADELRERARQFAASGNFREALRHLYIALLRHLDSGGIWRYNARQTNWEHIAALRSTPFAAHLIAPLSDVTRRFDRVRYGNANCTNEDWLRFAVDVEAIEKSAGKTQ
ncbi:MAG TPA: DUF4129 domain-containing protein [Abditibacteriaceae bacterium]|nr:DUF4129 domain-containing protein [Abditibacteriaceae bacterium]